MQPGVNKKPFAWSNPRKDSLKTLSSSKTVLWFFGANIHPWMQHQTLDSRSKRQGIIWAIARDLHLSDSPLSRPHWILLQPLASCSLCQESTACCRLELAPKHSLRWFGFIFTPGRRRLISRIFGLRLGLGTESSPGQDLQKPGRKSSLATLFDSPFKLGSLFVRLQDVIHWLKGSKFFEVTGALRVSDSERN